MKSLYWKPQGGHDEQYAGWGKRRRAFVEHNSENAMNYRDIITIEPGKRGGKPCIRGLRISVYEVLEYLAAGMTSADILNDFPDLTAADIQACLAYAADRERLQFTLAA